MADQCPPGSISYTIRAGDSFHTLAERFSIPREAIAAANPGVNPHTLTIGQVICIPRQLQPTLPRYAFNYIIKPGDTLYTIAQKYHVPVTAILTSNPGITLSNTLQVGQMIRIPGLTPPITCPEGTFSYLVKPGETLGSLARKYQTTIAAIIAINPSINPNTPLHVDQIICIPSLIPTVTCPPGNMSYVIKPGDTLNSIAQRYNTTVAAIINATPEFDPSRLHTGLTICIPNVTAASTNCPPNTIRYEIKPGDTLFTLANRFNTSISAIVAANPNINANSLDVGQIICIPMTMS